MQNEEEKKKERPSSASLRKASRKGVVTQKMMSFRIDADNAERLANEPNKGRLINELLHAYFEKH